MAKEPSATTDAKTAPATPPAPARRMSRRMLLLAAPLVPLAGGGAAVALLPRLRARLLKLLPTGGAKAPATPGKPIYVDIPQMVVTLPNGGQPRQLRIKLSLELAKQEKDKKPAALLTPPLYDALLTYLRTLREPELDGALSIDRLRGDLFRRADLMLGPGVLRDVLITGLVVG